MTPMTMPAMAPAERGAAEVAGGWGEEGGAGQARGWEVASSPDTLLTVGAGVAAEGAVLVTTTVVSPTTAADCRWLVKSGRQGWRLGRRSAHSSSAFSSAPSR
jgi:hypothetical protein